MIYLIHGEDDFLSHEILSRNKNNFTKKHSEHNISVFSEENSNIEEILTDIKSMSLLGGKRLVILEGLINKWNKEEKQRFVENIPEIPESTVVIFFENQKLKENDLILKNIPPKNIFYAHQLYGYEINNWIEKRIKENGFRIDKQALSTLAILVGNNSRQLDKEIKKLTALKYKEKVITEEDVKSLVKAGLDTNIFNLTDALAKKDLKGSQRVIKNIVDSGESLQSVLSMIAFQFRNLILIKIAEEEKIPKQELLKKSGMHPFVHQKTLAQLKNFSFEKLKKIYKLILDTDITIKTGEKEEGLAIDLLITKICM